MIVVDLDAASRAVICAVFVTLVIVSIVLDEVWP